MMQRNAQRIVLVLAVVFVSPFSVSAHDHDASCDAKNMDTSKMSPEDKQAMLTKCKEQLRAENCGITGVDMSMMSADDQKAMKEGCIKKMTQMGCDMKGIDVAKLSVAGTQKMMDQCHAHLVNDKVKQAPKSLSVPEAAPAPKA
jgi:hypothetical protein